jgi:hypothetical protein
VEKRLESVIERTVNEDAFAISYRDPGGSNHMVVATITKF